MADLSSHPRTHPDSSPGSPGRDLLHVSLWLDVYREHWQILAFLTAALDRGEAAVISLALHLQIDRVAIDEQAARHIARSCGLVLTGSLGLLLRVKQHGTHVDLAVAIERMRSSGIWISAALEAAVLRLGQATVGKSGPACFSPHGSVRRCSHARGLAP